MLKEPEPEPETKTEKDIILKARQLGFTTIHMSFANVFLFKGVTIDWHDYLGPNILRRVSHEPRNDKNISLRTWGLVEQFGRLEKSERDQYRII